MADQELLLLRFFYSTRKKRTISSLFIIDEKERVPYNTIVIDACNKQEKGRPFIACQPFLEAARP